MSGDIDWAGLLLGVGPPAKQWQAIFAAVRGLCDTVTNGGELEQALGVADRILADAAWDLWQAYPHAAPTAAAAARAWWGADDGGGPGPSGRALLVLDALSVREMRLIVAQARARGVELARDAVYGAEVPTDTVAFAQALGLTARAQLTHSGYPSGFALAGPGLHTDVPAGLEFGQLAEDIPPAKDVVLWHPWLDDLVHQHADKSGAAHLIAGVTKRVLTGEGFWRLVARLRTGRRVLITSDHGYALSGRFTELPGSYGERLRSHFGAQRCGKAPAAPYHFGPGQPVSVQVGERAAVIGPWRWKVQGGFPHVSHGGLTLAEVCVPVIEVAAA